MLKNLEEIIEGNESNYLLPFYWQHGDHRDRIPAQIERIFDSGARAFCVESRPHKDFCGDGWWQDMDIIMEEASKREMKVWVLDDDHFPTGHANGLIASRYPELRKWQLAEKHVDVVGPMTGASLLLPLIDDENESLIGVYAYRRDCYEEVLSDEPLTLTNNVSGSFLYWDIPSGIYRIFFLYRTRKGTNRPDYINMLDTASVDVLIEAVYEPHYRHYGKYFGNVFAGFFSDEPNLGNTMYGSSQAGGSIYDKKMGMPGLALPWSDAISEMMEETLGYSPEGCLPILWYDYDEKACRPGSATDAASYAPGRAAGTDAHTVVTGDLRTAEIRYAYMDAVTRLYRDSFTKRVGSWCRSHGVLYIGHIIEDMNSHARLGYSAGHYYRSLDGQDMSGMDIVLHQVLPGFTSLKHTSIASGGMVDPEFNHYVLAKLCSSMSHIYPLTKGRAMCEVFGAYGWAAGVPMMKWLIDFLLVRGVNYFVPHAFSPKYPDPDCPPHFGAEGHDPQFKGFSVLMKYTNKMSHLFEGTLHRADTALLYHAEAEWMTGDNCMLTQKPAKKLYDDHIDYDIIPADAFTRAEDPAEVLDGKLSIGREQYNCLVVPYSKYLPASLTEALVRLQDRGLSIYFVNAAPENFNSSLHASDVNYTKTRHHENYHGRKINGTDTPPNNHSIDVPLEDLSGRMRSDGMTSISVDGSYPFLRINHMVKADSLNNEEKRGTAASIYMLFNESVIDPVSTTVRLPEKGDYLVIDLLGGMMIPSYTESGAVHVDLAPYQSAVYVFGDEEVICNEKEIQTGISIPGGTRSCIKTSCSPPNMTKAEIPDLEYEISIADSDDLQNFKKYCNSGTLFNITSADRLPDFSGIIRYRTKLKIHKKVPMWLDLGEMGQQSASLKVNGFDLGTRICCPYIFDISGAMKDGINEIEIETANTLANKIKDRFSRYIQIPPSGLTGPLKLFVCRPNYSWSVN